MKKAVLAFITIMLLPCSSVAAALSPNDFAFGMNINCDPGGAIYRFTLPEAVYKNVMRPDLGDIEVFNADGKTVPHLLRARQRKKVVSETITDLPIFPWYGQRRENEGTGISLKLDNLRQPASITVETGGMESSPRPVKGYIVDTRSMTTSFEALQLILGENEKDLLATVTVEQSRDLAAWESVVSCASLARMRFQGHEITSTLIPIRAGRGRYLRIRWPGREQTITITGVRAVQKDVGRHDDLELWSDAEPISGTCHRDSADDTVISCVYDSKGVFPVDRVKIRFPEKNSLKRLHFYSGNDAAGPWHDHGFGVFYSFSFDKTTLAENTLAFAPTTHRFWRMTMKGDFPGTDQPTLTLGWLSHDLLFVARGKGPFLLAYGRSQTRAANGAENSEDTGILRDLLNQKNEDIIKPATLQPANVLGGEDVLKPVPEPLPWKKWLLWATLIAGVAVVGAMATSLMRKMQR